MSSEHDGEYGKYFDVRYARLAIPVSGVLDGPTVTIEFNVGWLGHLDGVIERLAWADAWEEMTPGDADWAIQQVYILLSLLGNTQYPFFTLDSMTLDYGRLG